MTGADFGRLGLLANDLGGDDLLTVDVVLDVNLLSQANRRDRRMSAVLLQCAPSLPPSSSALAGRGDGSAMSGTYVTAGLDVDLLDLARLDITAERSVCRVK